MKTIKRLLYKFIVLCLNFIYFFIKLLPTQNKVSFHSRLVEDEPLDFRLVREEIEEREPDCRCIMLLKRIPKKFIGKIGYFFYILKRMYHISTSKACVIDSYIIPISVLKHKKDLIVIQIPHGMGAIKKVGHQVIGKKEGSSEIVAEEMKMHKNYDYVIANGPEAGKWYVEGYKIDPKTISLIGMPRLDYLKRTKNKIDRKIKEMCSTIEEKDTIVYIPTFRKNGSVRIEDIINNVNFEKYNLIITCHPNNKFSSNNPNVIISTDEDIVYHEWIKACDYFITDYSSVVFEAMLLNKRIFLYVYDFDEYKESRGLNLNWFKELPEYSSKDPKEIIKMIEKDNYNIKKLDNLKDRYLSARNKNCTKEIVDLIFI